MCVLRAFLYPHVCVSYVPSYARMRLNVRVNMSNVPSYTRMRLDERICFSYAPSYARMRLDVLGFACIRVLRVIRTYATAQSSYLNHNHEF